jgi:hypothetical protein
MSSYEQRCQEDARLAILAELARQSDARLNSLSISRIIDALGMRRSRDWVENQLRRLDEFGAINLRSETISGMGEVSIATLTRTGRDHVERRALLAGVTPPMDEE